MKYASALILSIFTALFVVFAVNAQSPETIWIQANTTVYKTGETVTATVNANSATPIQGFTAQIRYDPACLQPVNATSPIPGMNGLALPQTPGLVDASFASSSPQSAVGVLAEIRFVALQGCQTSLSLESAALVTRDASGFAAPLPGVNLENKVVALNIDSAVGVPQATQPSALDGSVLPLAPAVSQPQPAPINWLAIVLLFVLVALAIATVIIVYKLSQK
ncbi:MAG: cohesin domain-containing protein [Chloroflexi bacterium]|nr:cohesin domain-containing protein [Chloroflexota bacterium]